MNTGIQFTPLLLALSISGALAQGTEQRSTLADQQDVAITIYNSDLALVKDHRKIQLTPGASSLAFRDVSARMRPETALMRSLNAPGSLSVLEQNFDFDLLTPQKMLEKYVGQVVTVVRTNPATGQETSEIATVLSANNGVVLKIGQRIETGMPGRLVFGNVPANLRDRRHRQRAKTGTETAFADAHQQHGRYGDRIKIGVGDQGEGGKQRHGATITPPCSVRPKPMSAVFFARFMPKPRPEKRWMLLKK